MRLGAAAFAGMAALATSAHAQSWRYEQSRDPLTDRPIYRASQTARSHSMNVRCKDDLLEVYLLIPGYLGDVASVRYRFDQGELRTNTWGTSTDGSGVFAPGPGEFARSLLSGSVLHFEVTGEYGSPNLLRIPLAGSAAAVGPVLDGCGVPRTEIYTPEGTIWRRPVEAIDAVSRDAVINIAATLKALDLYDGPVDRVRRRSLYEALSTFYSTYWQACRNGQSLSRSCQTWLSERRYNEDADYPKEPLELLAEFISEPSRAPSTGTAASTSDISWARRPALEYPAQAAQRGVLTGTVTLECRVAPNGGLSSCTIAEELPAGAGFGQEALRAIRTARVSPAMADRDAGKTVRFPLSFTMDPT